MADKSKRRGRGEASVYQRASDARWVGSLSLGYDGRGKRRRKVVYGATKRDVLKAIRRLQTQADTGSIADSGKLTIGEHLARWLATMETRLRPSTWHRYKDLAAALIDEIGSSRLADLRPQHVAALYARLTKRGWKPPTVRAAAQVLNASLKNAVKMKMLPWNPAAEVERPRGEHYEAKTLDPAQAQTLLDAAKGKRIHPLLVLALATGMRQGELLALQWDAVDFDAGTVTVRATVQSINGKFVVTPTKTRAGRRTITLPPFALDVLREHRTKQLARGLISAPVFCSDAGTYWDVSNMSWEFRRTLREAGLPMIRFHDLRHTHASQLLSAGASVAAVAKRLGHANPSITLMIYSHAMPSDDAELAQKIQQIQG